MQNTTKVRTPASDEMTLSTKGVMGKKGINISNIKVICTIN